MNKTPRYYVWTWDTDTQSFTPQAGIHCGPWSLRRAIRRLRAMGYSCGYSSKGSGDPSVKIVRVGSEQERQQ